MENEGDDDDGDGDGDGNDGKIERNELQLSGTSNREKELKGSERASENRTPKRWLIKHLASVNTGTDLIGC